MKRPDFFLVGAPKCGTSLMDTFLGRHPDLYMPVKELHYFGRDLDFNDPPLSEADYLTHFDRAPAGARCGESSTWYLYSRSAAQEIHDFCPEARIIIMLRNPVTMLYSLHSHQLWTGNEDIRDFGAALDAEPDRKAGRRIPPRSVPRGGLLYSEVASFSAQVARYYEVFGRDRVIVVLADDFKKDNAGVYQKVLSFLGARVEGLDYEAILAQDAWTRNENKSPRSRLVTRFLKQPRNQAVLRGTARGPLPGWRTMLRALRRANIRYGERPPMDPTVKARLTAKMAPDVAALGALIGRDLSFWSKV